MTFLSREYVRVNENGRRGFKVRLPTEYSEGALDVLNLRDCKSQVVPGRKRDVKK